VLAKALPPAPLPHFWVMSGNAAQSDMMQAQAFVDLVKQYQPRAPFLVIKGGQHNYVAWRQAFPKMFEWVTSQI
jgi:S-formylglutathione hydrolase FrmB